MKRFVIGFVCIIMLLAGCTGQQVNPAETCEPLPDVHRPTLEEIQEAYDIDDVFEYEDAPIALIADDTLWKYMHVQIVTYQNDNGYLAVSAVTGDCDEIIEIKPNWGSYTFNYVLSDLNEDGYIEMTGYFGWGSGIVRSIPFILNHSGEYIELMPHDEDHMSLYMYEEFRLSSDGKSVIANAKEVLGDGGDKQLRILFEDGYYYYEYH